MKPFGILVFGYARPSLLRNVLESLRRQDALSITHLFIDGDAQRNEFAGTPAASIMAAREFPLAELRTCSGHLGIEKLMLDGLEVMRRRYEAILVLEDDCFPLREAVKTFRAMLGEIASANDVFSVYGHHFMVPGEGDRFSRFQGWGWGTTSSKLEKLLPQLRSLFNLPEHEYLQWASHAMTPEVLARLDVTPGRNVADVLRRMYSWDSCTSLLCARNGLAHKKTPIPTIRNCGLTEGHGHFNAATKRLREPPFNMILPAEVWDHW